MFRRRFLIVCLISLIPSALFADNPAFVKKFNHTINKTNYSKYRTRLDHMLAGKGGNCVAYSKLGYKLATEDGYRAVILVVIRGRKTKYSVRHMICVIDVEGDLWMTSNYWINHVKSWDKILYEVDMELSGAGHWEFDEIWIPIKDIEGETRWKKYPYSKPNALQALFFGKIYKRL